MAAETFEQLVSDIRKHGIINPIILDEEFTVLDGHHRLEAARKAGLTLIDCIIRVNLTEDEKLEIAHKVNSTSRSLTPADKKRRAVELRSEQRSYRQIAVWLGVGKSTVERWIREHEGRVPNGTVNRVKGSDGKEYPGRGERMSDKIEQLESDNAELKAEIRKLKGEVRDRDLKIRQLEVELVQHKWRSHSSDNGLKVFAVMVGLKENASAYEINREFRKARARVHPDTGGSDWASIRYNVAFDTFKQMYGYATRSTG
jgi:ParB-like chromosome segregation protein Spo0J